MAVRIKKFLLAFFLCTAPVRAQDSSAFKGPASDDRETTEENLLENFTESSGVSQVSELLDYYRRNPLDINEASLNELEQIPGMPSVAAKEIIEYRSREKFVSAEDLLKIPAVTPEIFNSIIGFVTVRSGAQVKNYSGGLRQRTSRNVEQSENLRNGKYAGNNYHIYNRAYVDYRPYPDAPQTHVRAGGLLEKDPGENRLNDHQVGFVEFQNVPYFRKAIVGNYQLEFGQALALWGETGLSKSSESIQSVKRRGRGIRRYEYTSESAALFGGAAELDLRSLRLLRDFEVSVFYSRVHYDATFNADRTVNNVVTSGLHRDSSENSKRNYLLESLGGANVEYRIGASSVGITGYAGRYDHPFTVSDSIRDRYHFSGSANRILSGHYDIFFDRFNCFGEAARDQNHHMAFNSGIEALWPRVELILFYRNYAKDFNNLHGFAFGEQNGKTQNEEGVYTGIKLKPRRGTLVQAYYDVFRFPWRTPDVPKPVTGDDFLIQADRHIWKRTVLNVLFKNQRKDEPVKTQDVLGRDITVVERSTLRRFRYQLDYRLSQEIRLRSRVEQSRYRVAEFPGIREKGILFYQEMKLQPRSDVFMTARLSFFDIRGSHAAIYEYEDDMDGLFTSTRFSGKGKRWYLLAKYDWKSGIRLSVKYWELYRQDVSEVGSGGDAVKGRVLRKIAMALDVNF